MHTTTNEAPESTPLALTLVAVSEAAAKQVASQVDGEVIDNAVIHRLLWTSATAQSHGDWQLAYEALVSLSAYVAVAASTRRP